MSTDPISLPELTALVHAQVQAHGNYRAFADAVGLTPGYWCNVVNGQRKPGPKALALLGYSLANPPEPPRYIKQAASVKSASKRSR